MTGLFGFFDMVDDYDERKVRLDLVEGLIVSTAYSSDEGYETAIGDVEGNYHPVERYSSKELAIEGHGRWIESAKTLETIEKLGWLGVDLGGPIKLKRGLTTDAL